MDGNHGWGSTREALAVVVDVIVSGTWQREQDAVPALQWQRGQSCPGALRSSQGLRPACALNVELPHRRELRCPAGLLGEDLSSRL